MVRVGVGTPRVGGERAVAEKALPVPPVDGICQPVVELHDHGSVAARDRAMRSGRPAGELRRRCRG